MNAKWCTDNWSRKLLWSNSISLPVLQPLWANYCGTLHNLHHKSLSVSGTFSPLSYTSVEWLLHVGLSQEIYGAKTRLVSLFSTTTIWLFITEVNVVLFKVSRNYSVQTCCVLRHGFKIGFGLNSKISFSLCYVCLLKLCLFVQKRRAMLSQPQGVEISTAKAAESAFS